MRQFYGLFEKEFRGYFQSYFALAVVFIYLLISAGLAFYGSYLDMHDTALYALFGMQLYIQAALVPALTMKLWVEEYKTGTAEFLLTQPLKYYQPVLAKFFAAFGFGVFLSILLLPFIYDASRQITLDWGNILCAYVGLWAVIFVFCAIGSLISALNKNMILVYLFSLFATAFLAAVPFTHFHAAYDNFLLAEIGWGDVLYFPIIGATILLLNILVLQLRASSQKHKWLRFTGFGTLLLIGDIVLCFAVYTLFMQKYDMTAQQIYTPQQMSREIIKSLSEPIYADVYISRDYIKHNVEYTRYYQQVRRLLQKYEKLSDKKIKVRFLRVEPFSQLENVVIKSGLYYEENIYGSKDYFGAVIRNDRGEGVVIKHFLAARSPYLEKDIDVALLKLSRDDVMKTIGVYLDPFQNLRDFQGAMLNLENDYYLVNLTEDIYAIPPQVDLVLLVNPKELAPSFIEAVENYIAAGGKAVILFDFYTENQSTDINMKEFSLLNFISILGVEFTGNMPDIGKPAAEFAPSGMPLAIYKAVDFNLTNSAKNDYTVTPIITDDEHLIGVLLQGRFALFNKNKVVPETKSDGQVALIGDVDLIIDDNWVAGQSPDKNPYDAIAKTANMEILRSLIDRMVGNSLYFSLPVRYEQHNTFSIGEKIYNRIYEQNAPSYFRLGAELIEARSAIKDETLQNPDKIMQMLQSGEAGQKIADLELQAENLLYKMGREYKDSIRIMFMSQVILQPLFITLLLWGLIFLIARRREKKIRELIHE